MAFLRFCPGSCSDHDIKGLTGKPISSDCREPDTGLWISTILGRSATAGHYRSVVFPVRA